MTHTPGPWRAADKPVRPLWAQVLVDAEGNDIDQSDPANIRLIAAAPELLSVLEAIEAHCSVETGTKGAEHAAEGQRLRIAARAAIAKAKGEVK